MGEVINLDDHRPYTLADDPEEQAVIAEQEREAADFPILPAIDPEDAPVIIDKRGRNNPTALRRKAEREHAKRVKQQQKEAQEVWARQAAGTMWWMAQGQAQRGNTKLAEHTLRKREELITGARAQGLAV